MAKKPIEATYAASPARVFDACLAAVAQLGYTIQHSDKASHVLSFNTGRSMRSWGGQDVTAQLLGTADNGTRIVVAGRAAAGGMPGRGGTQVASWGELKKVARVFLKGVEAALPQVSEEESPPMRATASTPSPDHEGHSVAIELAELSRLRDQGAISEAEFVAAKARVLGTEEAASSGETAAPPAGWYPDPNVKGEQRWWDGAAWTDRVAPGS